MDTKKLTPEDRLSQRLAKAAENSKANFVLMAREDKVALLDALSVKEASQLSDRGLEVVLATLSATANGLASALITKGRERSLTPDHSDPDDGSELALTRQPSPGRGPSP